eukprot:Trichotokara_eunicae@DN3456_c0_g1_i3.p1
MGTEQETVSLGVEKFETLECYFGDAKGVHCDSVNLSQLLCQSINMCPIDSRKQLQNNIVLVGGRSPVKGLKQRLEVSLKDAAAPDGMGRTKVLAGDIRISNGSQQRNALWKGAVDLYYESGRREAFLMLNQLMGIS